MIAIKSFADLETLSLHELKQYMAARLKLLSTTPHIDRAHEEEPEDFLIEGIKRSKNDKFKDKVHTATQNLLGQEWKNVLMGKTFDSYYLSRLLVLVETFSFSGAHDIVLQMSSNSDFLCGKASTYAYDLYAQALRTLAFLQQGPPGYIERWVAVLKDEALSPYRPIALQGMRLCGLAEGLVGLNVFIKHAKNEEMPLLRVSISEIIYQYQTMKELSQIVEDIIDAVKESPLEARFRVCEVCKTIPALASAYIDMIVGELLPLVDRPDIIEEPYSTTPERAIAMIIELVNVKPPLVMELYESRGMGYKEPCTMTYETLSAQWFRLLGRGVER